ncbi:MAG TPA: hypothetical protein ENH82_18930 [bacterium]|nr:hypothetical protein [bacterium]
MPHDKRIVIDFDDTISIAFDRGWENASPNIDVVNKINLLYDKGWEIQILTARGQLSCQGNVKAADKKYREIIESWLKKHNVKYHSLSFNKPLAAYYVDDKAMSPEAFVDLDITDITTGWSGAEIQKRGDRIYKTHKNSIHVAKWYSIAASMVNVPKVHSFIGHTICLEYLKSNGRSFKINYIIDTIRTFSLTDLVSGVEFSNYIERISSHCNHHNDYHDVITLLVEQEDYFNNHRSFMHGDLSIENIIVTDSGTFLIDPLWSEDQYSSYLLDISKMLCSFRIHKRIFEYQAFLNEWAISKGNMINENALFTLKKLLILELSHFIRILKYAPENIKKDIVKCINDLFDDIRNNT